MIAGLCARDKNIEEKIKNMKFYWKKKAL